MSEPAEIPPFEPVHFENGLSVMLNDEGQLLVTTFGRGQRTIAIKPSSSNSCLISSPEPRITPSPKTK